MVDRSRFRTACRTRYEKGFQPTNARQLLEHAGMSSRPEYYSGRGATPSDLSVPELMCIYRYIESGDFPKGAEGAFVQMVKDIKLLAATPFIQSLEALEYRGWEPLEVTCDEEIAVGKNADGHHDMVGGMFGLFAMMGRNDDDRKREKATSEGWKAQFLAEIDGRRPPTDMYGYEERY